MNDKLYTVHWEIQIHAQNEVDAATSALEVLRDPESLSSVFTVTEFESNESTSVDLNEEE